MSPVPPCAPVHAVLSHWNVCTVPLEEIFRCIAVDPVVVANVCDAPESPLRLFIAANDVDGININAMPVMMTPKLLIISALRTIFGERTITGITPRTDVIMFFIHYLFLLTACD
jgi:hypothetical protein